MVLDGFVFNLERLEPCNQNTVIFGHGGARKALQLARFYIV